MPVPSDVFEQAVVGFSVVLQQTPRVVTVAPPSDVTLPWQDAVVVVIPVISLVVSMGSVCSSSGGS